MSGRMDRNQLVEQIQKVRREADQIKENIRQNREAMKDTSCLHSRRTRNGRSCQLDNAA